MSILLSNEIPYNELEKVGISKTNFLNLPTFVLDRLLTGRLSPVMRLLMNKGVDQCSFLAKIAFNKTGTGVELLIYPLMKDLKTEIELTENEIKLLKDGSVIKKKIINNDGKSVLSYVQLDSEINNLISMPIRLVYIPKSIGGIDLTAEEIKNIKQGAVVQLKDRNCCVGIDLEQRGGFRYNEGGVENWKKQLIEWDRINPDVIGYWNTSQNQWEYMQDKSNSIKR